MKRRIYRMLLILLLIAACVLGYAIFQKQENSMKTEQMNHETVETLSHSLEERIPDS